MCKFLIMSSATQHLETRDGVNIAQSNKGLDMKNALRFNCFRDREVMHRKKIGDIWPNGILYESFCCEYNTFVANAVIK